MTTDTRNQKTIEAPDDIEAVYEWFYEQDMTDGLPVIPPTPERVERMVRASKHDPDEVIATIQPRGGDATVAAIAANAVMAGCKPEYMPVLLAAAKALGDPELNVRGIQATTGGYAMLVLINGPIRKTLGVNCATNALGQGFRANATIGRAVRLMITNIGGVYPGKSDKGTMGNPGKYSLCVGENEEASPWQPFHVDYGFDRNDSTVTLVGASPGDIAQHHKDNDALSILTTLAELCPVRQQDHDYILWLCPERAADVARGGFSKKDVQQFFFENVRKTVRHHKKLGNWSPEWNAFFSKYVDLNNDDALIPAVYDPSSFNVVVLGGAGGINYWYSASGHWPGIPTPSIVGTGGASEMGSPVIVKIEA